ncbi:MAG: acylphosphatase [Thermodesulfobacteriota bacterium]
MNEKIRVHVIISGRVQGVCFRMETKREADSCGVSGWVRNLPDGNVEAVLEGERSLVEAVVAWCRQGPPASRVSRVIVTEQPAGGDQQGFRIVR